MSKTYSYTILPVSTCFYLTFAFLSTINNLDVNPFKNNKKMSQQLSEQNNSNKHKKKRVRNFCGRNFITSFILKKIKFLNL